MKKRNREFKKLVKYLEDGEFEVRFSWINKRTLGLVEPRRDAIILNLELHLVETYIHEYLHIQYPKLEEEVVEEKTRQVISRMNKEEILILADWLGHIYWMNKEKTSLEKGTKN